MTVYDRLMQEINRVKNMLVRKSNTHFTENYNRITTVSESTDDTVADLLRKDEVISEQSDCIDELIIAQLGD